MEPLNDNSGQGKCQQIYCKQPISCPWNSVQPYPNTTSKINQEPSTSCSSNDKSFPSIQQSSTQFFYFLRLMQLFPETHPATIHTVLCLCKNNFFYAVDKLLYARKCKAIYIQKQPNYRRCPYERSQPLSVNNESSSCRKDEVLDLKIQPIMHGSCKRAVTTSRNVSNASKSVKESVGMLEGTSISTEGLVRTNNCICRSECVATQTTRILTEPSNSSNTSVENVPVNSDSAANKNKAGTTFSSCVKSDVNRFDSSSNSTIEKQASSNEENVEIVKSIIQSDIIILP
ncbi:uncharacterized protein LOC130899520 [Diorhabda carinulata]|uniref:uncharacterized protein LOC130899520 n=1 Tax=Diorhabda carinulata TaxID=1163345 RepID=UPI0025A2DFAF|nr:uncharacterized protein LOC130899520 [Diorhabda carinulata]